MKVINDPIHGSIKIPTNIILDIINHPYFQRLRRISQTGLLSLIFPSAVHTRFQHVLGAMHLMSEALDTLKSKGVDISDEEKQAAMIAILLHDIGHGPFSHALEGLLVENWSHEKLSLLLMKELNSFFSGELSLAIEMFQGKYHRRFFNQLISSQLDVDRLDYLKRDSFFTGVLEGDINVSRIISMMEVRNDELLINEKGIYSIESFLTARMLMYWQVYYHKSAVLSEFILTEILRRVKKLIAQGQNIECSEGLAYFLYREKAEKISEKDILEFVNLDDSDVLQSLKKWTQHSDRVLSYYSNAVVNRRLPRSVMSHQPFLENDIQEKINQVNRVFGIEEGNLFVHQLERKLLPYDSHRQSIRFLSNNGQGISLEQSEFFLLKESLVKPQKRYVLSFPREI